MTKVQTAARVLETAEKRLRDLIAQAAGDGDYPVIAKLAEAAEGVRRATTALNGSIPTDPGAQSAAIFPPPSAGAGSAVPLDGVRKTTKEYPRFERQGDRLVKVGWSKKDRAEYEHRTEKDVALAVSLYLAEVPKEKTFRMDDLLPIEINGSEVPLYQAYLVLAWLRDRGQIGKQGKDGYQWLLGDFDEPAFEAAWGSTPRRN